METQETKKPEEKIKFEKKEMDLTKVIKYPLSTEKSLRLMESENKLIFVVDRKATKPEIKKAIEAAYKANVLKVNTLIDRKGNKRAYISFDMDTPAIDIATKLGLM